MITLTQDQLIDYALALSVACQYIKDDSNMNQVHTQLKDLFAVIWKEYQEEDPIAVEQPFIA